MVTTTTPQSTTTKAHKYLHVDPCMKIVGGIGTPDFFKHLINSLVFQNNLFSQGRCEFLLFVTPSVLLVIPDFSFMKLRFS